MTRLVRPCGRAAVAGRRRGRRRAEAGGRKETGLATTGSGRRPPLSPTGGVSRGDGERTAAKEIHGQAARPDRGPAGQGPWEIASRGRARPGNWSAAPRRRGRWSTACEAPVGTPSPSQHACNPCGECTSNATVRDTRRRPSRGSGVKALSDATKRCMTEVQAKLAYGGAVVGTIWGPRPGHRRRPPARRSPLRPTSPSPAGRDLSSALTACRSRHRAGRPTLAWPRPSAHSADASRRRRTETDAALPLAARPP